MPHHRHPGRPCTDEGFTLIELRVVVGSTAGSTHSAGEKSISFVASTAASADPKTVSVNQGTTVSGVFYAAAMSGWS